MKGIGKRFGNYIESHAATSLLSLLSTISIVVILQMVIGRCG